MKTGLKMWLAAAASAGMMAATPASAQPTAQQQAEGRIKRADTDGNGTVSLPEFQAFRQNVVATNPNVDRSLADPKKTKRAFANIDKDKNGELDLAEFTAMIQGQAKRN